MAVDGFGRGIWQKPRERKVEREREREAFEENRNFLGQRFLLQYANYVADGCI